MPDENPFVTISVLPETRDELRRWKDDQGARTYDELLTEELDIDVST